MYNALTIACEKGRQPMEALKLFDTMQKQGEAPDAFTYCAFLALVRRASSQSEVWSTSRQCSSKA